MKQEEIDKYSEELKTCPFCGGVAVVKLFLGRYAIACTNCPACMVPSPINYNEFTDTYGLVERWNTRNYYE